MASTIRLRVSASSRALCPIAAAMSQMACMMKASRLRTTSTIDRVSLPWPSRGVIAPGPDVDPLIVQKAVFGALVPSRCLFVGGLRPARMPVWHLAVARALAEGDAFGTAVCGAVEGDQGAPARVSAGLVIGRVSKECVGPLLRRLPTGSLVGMRRRLLEGAKGGAVGEEHGQGGHGVGGVVAGARLRPGSAVCCEGSRGASKTSILDHRPEWG